MKFHRQTMTGIYVVQSYDESGIVINDARYTSNVILSAEQLTEDWSVRGIEELNETSCRQIAEHGAEIVLLGTGARYRMVEPRLLAWFARQGMGLEVMDTMAACRTYNILAGESRAVVAALMIEPFR